MTRFFVFFCLYFCLCSKLDVKISNEGTYDISLDGKVWFSSSSTGFKFQKQWWSNDGVLGDSNMKLTLSGKSTKEGSDMHGAYTETTLYWQIPNYGIVFETSFACYQEFPAIIFTQRFPNGTMESFQSNKTDVVSSFPSFKVNELIFGKKNYLTFSKVFAPSKIGKWNELNLYRGGYYEGSPLVIYDENLDGILIAPLDSFFISVQVRDSESLKKDFACGIGGEVNGLTKGFEHSTLLFAGNGMNSIFKGYGDFQLGHYGKRRATYSDDLVLQFLGYYTDNGAYYYYITEKDKNYEDTMIDVWKYMTLEQDLPIRHFQYDSWWYYKTKDGGLKLWEPRPDVFPNGMEYLNKIINLPITLHNRWFTTIDNDYMTQMNFSFILDQENDVAIPLHSDVYEYIMKKAISYGLHVYEQDWLSKTYEKMPIIRNTPQIGQNWFTNMFSAAQKLGLKIQLCMPYPAHVLSTLYDQDNVVTHIRASNDYQPRRKQWDIGYTSLFYWFGLGVFPFKDNFWTTDEEEKGCKYKICNEPNPILQTIITAFSGAPVVPSDQKSQLNVSLIMETCMKDGTLLKPFRPATVIDAVFKDGFHDILQVHKHIYSTFNCIKSSTTTTEEKEEEDETGECYFYVLGADLMQDFDFQVNMLPQDQPDKKNEESSSSSKEFWAIEYVVGEEAISNIQTFDESHSITFKKTGIHVISEKVDSQMFQIIPKSFCSSSKKNDNEKYLFLKEMKKIVSASTTRIEGIECSLEGSDLDFMMKVKGSVGEKATFALLEIENQQITYPQCSFTSSGTMTISCQGGNCSCQ